MNVPALAPWLTAACLAFGSSAALAGMSALPPANAAPAATKVYQGGTLIGLNGVTVQGSVYDMRMAINTSCALTFGGCDAVSDFTFTTAQQALAASNAVLAALSVDDFRLDPFPQNGVGFMTPYALTTNQYSPVSYAYALVSSFGEVAVLGSSTGVNTGHWSGEHGITSFAVWTPSVSVSAVPEPGTYALMLAGLGAVGFMARRRRSA